MAMPKKVLIQECCPRDGWQNHTEFIATETKIRYIKRMIDHGARMIEVTSFVNPKIMPQMADAKAVYAATKEYAEKNGAILSALVLNNRGVEDAKAAGVHTIEFVLSASEEHNMRNSRCTIQESMNTFKEMARSSDGADIMLCIPCVFGSPFGDEIPLERLKWIATEARSVGVLSLGLADTAGIGTPDNTRKVLRYLADYVELNDITVHFHDTHGMGIANAYVALEEGISRFDASLAAMGGCPFSPGAKGNIATEDLVNMCESMGIDTGYHLNDMILTAKDMCNEINADLGGSICLVNH